MQNQVFDLIPIINENLKRNPYDHRPVILCEVLTILDNILEIRLLKLNEKLINFLQEMNKLDYKICLNGLLGICSPNTCDNCQKIKELGEHLWNKWCSIASSGNNIIYNKNEVPYPIPNKRKIEITTNINEDDELYPLINRQHEIKKNLIIPNQECGKKTCFRGISCTWQDCQYLHPNQILCKYGNGCSKPACPYIHIENNKPMTQIYDSPRYTSQNIRSVDNRFQTQHNQNYSINNKPRYFNNGNSLNRNKNGMQMNAKVTNDSSNLYQEFI